MSRRRALEDRPALEHLHADVAFVLDRFRHEHVVKRVEHLALVGGRDVHLNIQPDVLRLRAGAPGRGELRTPHSGHDAEQGLQDSTSFHASLLGERVYASAKTDCPRLTRAQQPAPMKKGRRSRWYPRPRSFRDLDRRDAAAASPEGRSCSCHARRRRRGIRAASAPALAKAFVFPMCTGMASPLLIGGCRRRLWPCLRRLSRTRSRRCPPPSRGRLTCRRAAAGDRRRLQVVEKIDGPRGAARDRTVPAPPWKLADRLRLRAGFELHADELRQRFLSGAPTRGVTEIDKLPGRCRGTMQR